ncbi:MAG TPA: hypothetical protein PLK08_08670, partial [Phycisphaerae bacterium]|nr:hypothetical protein [Phycisphaerae bacterium]
MVATNDEKPSENALGIIDAMTPIGRKFEVGENILEYFGMDEQGNIRYSENNGPLVVMSVDSWNANKAQHVEGYTDQVNPEVTDDNIADVSEPAEPEAIATEQPEE